MSLYYVGWVIAPNSSSLLFLTRYVKLCISIATGRVILHLVVWCLEGHTVISCLGVYFSHCNCSYAIYTNFSMHIVEELGYGFISPAKAFYRFWPEIFLISFHMDFEERALIHQLESSFILWMASSGVQSVWVKLVGQSVWGNLCLPQHHRVRVSYCRSELCRDTPRKNAKQEKISNKKNPSSHCFFPFSDFLLWVKKEKKKKNHHSKPKPNQERRFFKSLYYNKKVRRLVMGNATQ